jgi:hypothetical protein
MKDLYVNTPSEETIHVSKALLTNNKNRWFINTTNMSNTVYHPHAELFSIWQ